MNELNQPDHPAPSQSTTDSPRHSGETEVASSADAHLSLRLWLRLLACSNLIETHLGQRLRQEFGFSLPRFDLLAQLHRSPQGLRMKELSQRLMVTGGSVTGLADQLEREGLLQRQPVEGDRRVTLLQLTPLGRQRFEAMAEAHAQWVSALFDHLRVSDRQSLYVVLGQLRQGLLPSVKSPPPRSSG
jgi:DNA-binding MarR family transcriptional regulator